MTEYDLGIEGIGPATIVGRGSFGSVYLATELAFDRTVAVKLLLQQLDDSGRRSFERECLSMGRLDRHPNVVRAYRYGFSGHGWPFLMMEYLDGGSLADLLQARGRIPWEEVVQLVVPVARALGYGHQRGILHNDIKPANIMLDEWGTPRVADYGIAAVRDRTGTVTLKATLAHTPPETFGDGGDRRDARSDLYSLASTVYALVVGRAPFDVENGSDSQPAYLMRIASQPVPLLGDRDLDHFFAVALAKDPDQRPISADAFIDLIKSTRSGSTRRGEAPASVGLWDRSYLYQYLASRSTSEIHQTLERSVALIERDPGDALAHLIRGNACQALGDHEEAVRSYTLAIEHDPCRVTLSVWELEGAPRCMWEGARNKGFFWDGDPDDGELPFMGSETPIHSIAYYCRGEVARIEGRFDTAVDDYMAAVEHNPVLGVLHGYFDNGRRRITLTLESTLRSSHALQTSALPLDLGGHVLAWVRDSMKEDVPQRQASNVTNVANAVNDVWETTPRNVPCPCGSGKKYKVCHGR